ncbi:OLC1v1035350C1 [Oldenlandia corymbosa var. corymbosa]|uniref:OLC1v1035350C1 n=1 Tax=Oldenlandia corymbosa var. corymbosa TaxID=529605 RepID=A0AAV1CSU7_OLDCO|nr:OLC1v1035350C1 [Oldenlandia corymbosa var. corymbosa]
MMKGLVMLIGILAGYFSATSADDGFATFYTIYNPSACYGNDTPLGLIAAVSHEIWDNGNACGRRYRVTCTGGTNNGVPHPCIDGETVEVEVVDFCPGCPGAFDLSKDAFAAIADTDAGYIGIEYDQI